MSGRSRWIASCSAALVVLTGVGPLDAPRASEHGHVSGWRACSSLTVTGYSGARYRISAVRVRSVACRRARSVIHDFYSQVIGSSGATVALGFGCVYRIGSRVNCRSRSGSTYDGSRQLSWRERAA